MKGKSALMSGVAVIALVALAQAGYAQKSDSDSTSNSAPAPVAATQSGPTTEELSARIDALEEELQQSELREAADHDAIAGWKPISGWWDNTSISGRMYWDLSTITNKNNGVANTSDGTHFDIKRFYIGVDHKFDDVWSANVTTDFTYDSTVGATQVFIKKAYLQGKFDDALTVRVGSADMAWIPFAESVYGYRYIENTLIDRVKYGNSADWGVHLFGAVGSDIKLEYQFSAVNGAGYKKPGMGLGTNRSEGMDYEGRVDVRWEDFVAGVGGYSGKLGNDHGPGTTFHTAQRFDALIGYVGNGIHAGVEYFSDTNFDTVTNTKADSGEGWSGFAAYQFLPEWAIFGRYDSVKPTKGILFQPHFTNDYENVGIEWTPTKIVSFSLVYKHDGGHDGDFADSNGTIGGTSTSTSGAYNEIGVFGQVQW
jgi:hypothetical protein